MHVSWYENYIVGRCECVRGRVRVAWLSVAQQWAAHLSRVSPFPTLEQLAEAPAGICDLALRNKQGIKVDEWMDGRSGLI